MGTIDKNESEEIRRDRELAGLPYQGDVVIGLNESVPEVKRAKEGYTMRGHREPKLKYDHPNLAIQDAISALLDARYLALQMNLDGAFIETTSMAETILRELMRGRHLRPRNMVHPVLAPVSHEEASHGFGKLEAMVHNG